MRTSHLALLLLVCAGCTKQGEDESASKEGQAVNLTSPSGIDQKPPRQAQQAKSGLAEQAATEELKRLVQIAAEHEKIGEYEQLSHTQGEILTLVEKLFGRDSWQAVDARLSIAKIEHVSRLTPGQREKLTEIRRLSREARDAVYAGQNKRALAIYTKILDAVPEVWPERSHSIAHYAFLKAQVSVSMHHREKAERLLRFAIPILEENLGRVHPEYATALNSLGMLQLSMGRLDEADGLLREATELTEQVWGRRSRQMGTQLNNLGTLWHAMKRYEEAEEAFLEALETQQQTAGPDHASVAHTSFNLGALYVAQGGFKKAVQQLERAAAIYEREAAPDSWTQIRTLSSLATAYYALKQYAEAEALLRRVVEFGDSEQGPASDIAADASFRLAMSLCFQAKYDEAEPLLLRALEGRRRQFGDSSLELLPPLRAYAELLDRTGRKASAEHVMAQVHDIRARTASKPPVNR